MENFAPGGRPDLMALIRCADCDHQVSDLATACPQCAWPVSARRAARAEGEEEPKARPAVEPNPELDRAMLALREQLRTVLAAPPSAAPKYCRRCKADVSRDMSLENTATTHGATRASRVQS